MAENKVGKPVSKSIMYQSLAEATGLSRKQIASVFDELTNLIKRVNKPATEARQGRNPATGEPMMIKAKPARTIVRAQPLKSLKEMVQ